MFHVVKREIELDDTLSTTDSAGQELDFNRYYLKHDSIPSLRLLQNSGKYKMYVSLLSKMKGSA